MGVLAFAARAEREPLATGERVRKRSIETTDELTAQEAQIARLARDGLSNTEIGARLFIGQHTVAYHLRKLFSKFDITSRNQLAGVLPETAAWARRRSATRFVGPGRWIRVALRSATTLSAIAGRRAAHEGSPQQSAAGPADTAAFTNDGVRSSAPKPVA
jgi:DNA-binding CsgD family transcriptional regulator